MWCQGPLWPVMLPSSDAALPLAESPGTGDTGDTGPDCDWSGAWWQHIIGRVSQPVQWHRQWHPARDGAETLLSEFLSRSLFTQARVPSAESDHNSFVVNPSPRNRRRGKGTHGLDQPDQSAGQLLSSFLAPELAGHSRLSVSLSLLSLFVSSSRYHPPPSPGSS